MFQDVTRLASWCAEMLGFSDSSFRVEGFSGGLGLNYGSRVLNLRGLRGQIVVVWGLQSSSMQNSGRAIEEKHELSERPSARRPLPRT